MTGIDDNHVAAVPMSLDAHVAVQTVEMRHMREALERIETSIGFHVTRVEWEQRNGYVDGQFRQHDVEIGNMKKDASAEFADLRKAIADDRARADAARAPWWVVLGAGLGIVSAIVAVMGVILK